MAHLIRADFAVPHLLAHLRPDGWFPRLVLGQQEFLFNGPGLTWLVALLRLATFGTLSTTGALKIIGVAGVAGLPPAVAFLARSYGLSRPAAGLAGVLSLLVSSPYGPGLQGLFRVGLVPNPIGAGRILFPIGLGGLVVAGWLYQSVVAARARGPAGDRAAATLVWVLVPAVYLPLAYGLLSLLGPGDITLQLPNRGLGYVGLMA